MNDLEFCCNGAELEEELDEIDEAEPKSDAEQLKEAKAKSKEPKYETPVALYAPQPLTMDMEIEAARHDFTSEEEALEGLNDLIDGIKQHMGLSVNITVEVDGMTTKVRQRRAPNGYILEIGYKTLAMIKRDMVLRLMRELTHIANDIMYIPDTCGAAYHTETFKKSIEQFGVVCGWTRSHGYAGGLAFVDNIVKLLPPILTSVKGKPDVFNFDRPFASLEKILPAKEVKVRAPRKSGFQPAVYETTCPHCGHVFHTQRGVPITVSPKPLDEMAASAAAAAELLA